jgi:hypothetical protein
MKSNTLFSLGLMFSAVCAVSPSLHHTAKTCTVWEASWDASGPLWECLGAPGVTIRTAPACKHWSITQGDNSQLWECQS